MDLSRVDQVPAQQRAVFAKYLQSMEDFDRRCTKGSALILPNALMRGIATAIFWLYTPCFEHRTFGTCAEGLAWLRELLAPGEHDRSESDARELAAFERLSAPPPGPASTFPERRSSIPGASRSAPASGSVPPPQRGSTRSTPR
jgi:hypothetical protein